MKFQRQVSLYYLPLPSQESNLFEKHSSIQVRFSEQKHPISENLTLKDELDQDFDLDIMALEFLSNQLQSLLMNFTEAKDMRKKKKKMGKLCL